MLELLSVVVIFTIIHYTLKAGDKQLASLNEDELKAHNKNFKKGLQYG